jgi:N,N'-diacetyllegionaminate synthase
MGILRQGQDRGQAVVNGVFVIAEAGVNHNGDMGTARRLIDAAAQAGANAVKFQTFKAENLVSRRAPKADYQLATTDRAESQYEMIRRLELDEPMHRDLIAHCSLRGIRFLSTPFDSDSLDLLMGLGMDAIKIPSGEATNLPFLRLIGAQGKDVILSTGMCSLGEVEAALGTLIQAGTPRDRIVVLHANTEYPTPMPDVNLRAMAAMGNALGVPFGYSDHTRGIEIPIAAVALGASVIEKHFTLDRNMEGPDHKASLEPDELKAMVAAIRNVSLALGSGIKTPSASEAKNIPIARKSLHARVAIRAGEPFTAANLTAKRPGTGVSPMRWDEFIGKPAPRDYDPDEML